MDSSAFLTVLLLGIAMNSAGLTAHKAGKSAAGTSKPATSKSSSSSKSSHIKQTTASKNSSKGSPKESKAAANPAAAIAPAGDSKAAFEAMEAEVVKGLEQQSIQANLKKDRAWFQDYLADDLTGANAQGVFEDKARLMARCLDSNNIVESKTYDELTVRPYGEDVMIATGKLTEKGRSNNTEYNVQRTFTHVWVNRFGQWQQVAIHESPIAAGNAPSQPATPSAGQPEKPGAVVPSESPAGASAVVSNGISPQR